MGKKTVKKGSMLGYLWALIGMIIAVVSLLIHLNVGLGPVSESLSFMAGDDNVMFRYIGMGVGGVLLLIGFVNLPRKKKK